MMNRLLSMIIFAGFSQGVSALSLLSTPFPPGTRVAIYIGTFSPLHHRHEEIVEGLLASGGVDYVVVVANDVNLHKPDAVPAEHRIEMLWRRYRSHPKVLVLQRASEFAFPRVGNITRFLRERVGAAGLVGVMGLDSVESARNRLAARLVPRAEWLITSARPLSEIRRYNSVAGVPAHYLEVPAVSDPRSTEIRKKLANRDLTGLPIDDSILGYIAEHPDLYAARPPSTPAQRARFCGRQLLGLLKSFR